MEFSVSNRRRLLNKSKTMRADITFPVGRVHRHMRNGRYSKRIGVGGAVYAAVVLEYLVAELLELSGNETSQAKRVRILPCHIMRAIRKDEELNLLLSKVMIPAAGVVPNVHPILLKTKKQSNPK